MRYADLLVWQKAMDLVVEIYRLCELLPTAERYGLISQMQRAAVSIPSNIAEGHARKSTGAFQNHLSIAAGSLAEPLCRCLDSSAFINFGALFNSLLTEPS